MFVFLSWTSLLPVPKPQTIGTLCLCFYRGQVYSLFQNPKRQAHYVCVSIVDKFTPCSKTPNDRHIMFVFLLWTSLLPVPKPQTIGTLCLCFYRGQVYSLFQNLKRQVHYVCVSIVDKFTPCSKTPNDRHIMFVFVSWTSLLPVPKPQTIGTLCLCFYRGQVYSLFQNPKRQVHYVCVSIMDKFTSCSKNPNDRHIMFVFLSWTSLLPVPKPQTIGTLCLCLYRGQVYSLFQNPKRQAHYVCVSIVNKFTPCSKTSNDRYIMFVFLSWTSLLPVPKPQTIGTLCLCFYHGQVYSLFQNPKRQVLYVCVSIVDEFTPCSKTPNDKYIMFVFLSWTSLLPVPKPQTIGTLCLCFYRGQVYSLFQNPKRQAHYVCVSIVDKFTPCSKTPNDRHIMFVFLSWTSLLPVPKPQTIGTLCLCFYRGQVYSLFQNPKRQAHYVCVSIVDKFTPCSKTPNDRYIMFVFLSWTSLLPVPKPQTIGTLCLCFYRGQVYSLFQNPKRQAHYVCVSIMDKFTSCSKNPNDRHIMFVFLSWTSLLPVPKPQTIGTLCLCFYRGQVYSLF